MCWCRDYAHNSCAMLRHARRTIGNQTGFFSANTAHSAERALAYICRTVAQASDSGGSTANRITAARWLLSPPEWESCVETTRQRRNLQGLRESGRSGGFVLKCLYHIVRWELLNGGRPGRIEWLAFVNEACSCGRACLMRKRKSQSNINRTPPSRTKYKRFHPCNPYTPATAAPGDKGYQRTRVLCWESMWYVSRVAYICCMFGECKIKMCSMCRCVWCRLTWTWHEPERPPSTIYTNMSWCACRALEDKNWHKKHIKQDERKRPRFSQWMEMGLPSNCNI